MPALKKYPWEIWLSSQYTEITQGVDYFISQSMMHQTIRNNASKRDLKVKITDIGCGMILEIIKETKSEVHHTAETTISDEHQIPLGKDGSTEEEAAQFSAKDNGRYEGRNCPSRHHHNPPRPTPIRR